MKKISLILALLLVAALCLASCGDDPIDDDGKITGGWTYSNVEPGTLPEDAEAAFAEALDGFDGASYKPLACIGKQIVSGINYAVIAQKTVVSSDTDPELSVLFISKSVSGTTKLTSIKPFKVDDYVGDGEDSDAKGSTLTGGWVVPTTGELTTMPQKLASAWSDATSDYDGMSFEVLASVGTQAVAGTNYALICRGKTVSLDANSGIYLVVLSVDLSDNATISSVSPIDVSEIAK